MTVNDMMKRLLKMNPDKVIVFCDSNNGWANIENIEERDNDIKLTIEETPVFEN